MKVQVPVAELRIGMIVEELDRPWVETPFLFQGFVIETPKDIERLQKYCEYVYVTTEQTRVTPVALAASRPAQPATTMDKLKRLWRQEGQLRLVDSKVIHQIAYRETVPIEQELGKARGVRDEVTRVVDRMYADARMGRSVDTGYAKEIIADLADSALRNPDAHMLLTQLRRSDRYAAEHSLNVSSLSLAFGRHLGLSRDNLVVLGLGAMLIDVGNIKIPAEVMNKRGELSPEEFALIRQHPAHGLELLMRSASPPPAAALEIVYSHHERMNGSGYPEGLRGDSIPLFARMVAIVDVYDAITTDRGYRQGQTPSNALRDLYDSRRGQFDEKLVEQFIQCLGIYPIGSVVQCNTRELGIVIAQNPERRLRPKLLLVRDSANHPYPMPKVVDLSRITDSGVIDVTRMVRPAEFDIDVGAYAQDLSWTEGADHGAAR